MNQILIVALCLVALQVMWEYDPGWSAAGLPLFNAWSSVARQKARQLCVVVSAGWPDQLKGIVVCLNV